MNTKKRTIKAVIFDLDGVIAVTDDCHYKAWKKLADEEGIYFDRNINERLRGVSRAESLEIVLEKAEKRYTAEEKAGMAHRKNLYYRETAGTLTPKDVLPGVLRNIAELKKKGVKIAIGSSSKNTPLLLERLQLSDCFDAVTDGNDIKKSKPDPEVFLKAAERLGTDPCECLVVEDAQAGIDAGRAAGMVTLSLGKAAKGDFAFENLAKESIAGLIAEIESVSADYPKNRA